MASYSLPTICEIKAQTDHCPREAQPFLVLRPDGNHSQDCCKQDTVEGDGVHTGTPIIDVAEVFTEQFHRKILNIV
jgi:hypothetical protein